MVNEIVIHYFIKQNCGYGEKVLRKWFSKDYWDGQRIMQQCFKNGAAR